MYSLRKIKELKKYRFFQNYKWDEADCKLFKKYNLIYGWNGCGKTTLCDFYRDLEAGVLSEDDASFSLMFDSSPSNNVFIDQSKMGTIPYRFKVFHQNYIQENIGNIDAVKHIFSVGKEQAAKIGDIKQMRVEAKTQEAIFKRLETELEALLQEFERFKTARARDIKESAIYTNAYNKNKFYEAFQRLSHKKELSESEYQAALAAVRAQMMPLVQLFEISFIQPTVKEYITDILRQTPVNNTIESLKQNAKVGDWVETGLSLHDESNTEVCLFCGSKIPQQRLEALRDHFNKSYKELSDKIVSAITLLNAKRQQFEQFAGILPNQALLYPELQQEYSTLYKKAVEVCKQYQESICNIISTLEKKKCDMINDSLVFEFATVVDELSFDYSVFRKILELFERHNQKTSAFEESKKQAQRKIEEHLVSRFYDETKEWEKKLSDKEKELKVQTEALTKLKNKITTLEQEIRNSQIPADAINRDIAFIMGRSELIFTNSDLGYQIKRNGKRATNLSKGEENAIALIYFFNTLLDVESDAQNTIIVLDDPISSFDSNFYYNAIGYIREKSQQVGQVFVFTHKFALLKDFSLMFGDQTNQYIIQRSNNSPVLVNLDNLVSQYHDEYAYLFKKIYEFVKNPPSDTSEYLQYPNMARRVLEGFLTFKLPSSKTMIDKVLELENNRESSAVRSIMRLLNNHSHLRVIPGAELSDDIDSISALPDTLNNLMEFIKYHDNRHYDTLASLCDPEYDKDGDAVTIILPPTRIIKLFSMSASAGFGNFLENDPDADDYETTNQDCTFAVRIEGDSMEPDVHNGNIVLVKSCEVVENARRGIVWYDGKCYCKKIVQGKNGIILVSTNSEYKPIPVISLDSYRLFGEVIEIIEN